MRTIYADMSALLRVVLAQPGERMPTSKDVVLVSSEVVEIEAARALDKSLGTGVLSEQEYGRKVEELAGFLGSFHLFPLAREMIELARAGFPMNVSALHAIHVATAQVIVREAAPLEFWSHLADQSAAAAVRGLKVFGVKGSG